MRDLLKQVPLLQSQEARDFLLSLIDLPNRDGNDDVDCGEDLDELQMQDLFEE